MNLGTQKFFGTTTFGIRHISTACIGSYKSTPLIALILASNVVILSWSISLDDFDLWDSLENVFTTIGADVGAVDYTNARLYWWSWPYSPTISLSWVVVWVWTKVTSRLEGLSP